VLNSTPDLPLLFLFVQLIIAVVLLHVSALFTPKVEIPKLELHAAKKLFPVVSINIIGLVFNMLCLRDVEASFFQVWLRNILDLQTTY
jgi:solute carrier family 35 (GDP-fucose transporter), member C1